MNLVLGVTANEFLLRVRYAASRPWHHRLGIDYDSFADDFERPCKAELGLEEIRTISIYNMYATMFNGICIFTIMGYNVAQGCKAG